MNPPNQPPQIIPNKQTNSAISSQQLGNIQSLNKTIKTHTQNETKNILPQASRSPVCPPSMPPSNLGDVEPRLSSPGCPNPTTAGAQRLKDSTIPPMKTLTPSLTHPGARCELRPEDTRIHRTGDQHLKRVWLAPNPCELEASTPF